MAAERILLRGPVQGRGVRPLTVRLAEACGISGSVRNTDAGVAIHAEGTAAALASFRAAVRQQLQLPGSDVALEFRTDAVTGARGFRIHAGSSRGPLTARIPPDVGLCRLCRRELEAPDDHRSDHAFISCAVCGPRFSILRAMPWDRDRTAMAAFPLCSRCSAEFTQPSDRRFHAQTIACPDCGPQLWMADPDRPENTITSPAAILAAVTRALRGGRVVALKGVGGYQLACDATSAEAVAAVRARKQRPAKPLAIMIRDAAEIASQLTDAERAALISPANPIVLVDGLRLPGVVDGVNSGASGHGVFLPSTGLHQTILNRIRRPLVVTSANRDGEPMAWDTTRDSDACRELADLVVHHDRAIVHPVDDSVVRVSAGRTVTIRTGRGLSPRPLPLSSESPLLAVGAHQKVAIALAGSGQAVLGPALGDMTSERAREHFVAHVRRMCELYRVAPEVLVHDQHPDLFTTRWAVDSAAAKGLATIPVQHHHAHVVSAMVEHGLTDRRVLGIAFDGTGYGGDGTIWGGEFLLATAGDFERVGSVRPFRLPGGDAVVRAPWKTAVALTEQAGIDSSDEVHRFRQLTEKDRALRPAFVRLCRSPRSLVTSSLGRLFDGVAALVLSEAHASYEGELAWRLEAVCDPTAAGRYDFAVSDGESVAGAGTQLNWRPVLPSLLADRDRGVPPGTMAMRFHRALADAVAAVARRFPDLPVVLSGGCFQNRVLTELCVERLASHPAGVFSPGWIPPNDGGLAVGQLAVAMARTGANRKSMPCV